MKNDKNNEFNSKAHELRKSIGFIAPKGLREVNYNFELYQDRIISHQDKFIDFLVSKLEKSRDELESEFNELI